MGRLGLRCRPGKPQLPGDGRRHRRPSHVAGRDDAGRDSLAATYHRSRLPPQRRMARDAPWNERSLDHREPGAKRSPLGDRSRLKRRARGRSAVPRTSPRLRSNGRTDHGSRRRRPSTRVDRGERHAARHDVRGWARAGSRCHPPHLHGRCYTNLAAEGRSGREHILATRHHFGITNRQRTPGRRGSRHPPSRYAPARRLSTRRARRCRRARHSVRTAGQPDIRQLCRRARIRPHRYSYRDRSAHPHAAPPRRTPPDVSIPSQRAQDSSTRCYQASGSGSSSSSSTAVATKPASGPYSAHGLHRC